MRVAIVNKFLYRLGGSQTVVITESDLLRHAGCDIFYFGVNHPNTMENLDERRFFPDYMDLSNAAKQFSLFKRFHFSGRVLYNIQAKQKFGEFLDHYQPDIIHCHNIYNHLSPSILHAAKARNIPVVMSLHDYHLVCPNYTLKRGLKTLCSDRRCYGGKYWHCILNKCVKKSLSASILGSFRLALHRRMHWFEKNIKVFIAPSKFLKNAMIDDGIPEHQIFHLYNTLPFDLYKHIKKLQRKRHILFSGDRYRNPFIYIGRISVEKGLLSLVKAFSETPKQELWIVGTGPQEAELRKFISSRRATNIKLLGYKSGKELWALLQQAYMICLPSECFEVMPVSLIEAFAFGIPAIGARVGGIPEIIHHEKTGWLFESGNINSLKKIVQRSLNINAGQYKQMALKAQEWVQHNHSLESHINGLLKVYKIALSSS